MNVPSARLSMKLDRRPGLLNGLLVAVLLLTTLLQLRPAVGHAQAGNLTIYDDGLAGGWENWSWSSTVNFGATTPVHSGNAAISLTYTSAWAGLNLRTASPVNTSGYDALSFWVHGGSSGTRELQVYIQTTDSAAASVQVPVSAPSGRWTEVTLPLSSLGSPGQIARIAIQDRTGGAQPTFYVDDLQLVADGSTGGGDPGGSDPGNQTGEVSGTVNIDLLSTPQPIDARLLGSNLPAWLTASRFGDATFQARTAASGVTVVRMPGGSWSNAYGWLSCELRANQSNALPCGGGWESWVARPTDFIDFLQATGTQGMWVVSPNGTAQEAAAAVAFFNASVNDTTVIGVDRKGFDWKTAGHWAQLRTTNGNAAPVNVQLWAVGNEVYGTKPSAGGALCAEWGWEDFWTCDGTAYVNGLSNRDGFTDFFTAMKAVDSSVDIAAVGVPYATEYANWGNKVIAAAGSTMDYYDIHQYAYFDPPASNAALLAQPHGVWTDIKNDVQAAFATNAGGRELPIAVTEYNLFSVHEQDNNQLMTRMVNALFMADTIGQMAVNGFSMANQWDLANGRASNGTEYGLMHEDNGFFRSPQYYVFPLWSRFGSELLTASSSYNPATEVSVYAGRVDGDTVSVLAINKTDKTAAITVAANGAQGPATITGGLVDRLEAASLNAQTTTFNGVANPSNDLSNAPSQVLGASGASIDYVVAPNSIALLRLDLDTSGAPQPTATNT
ncbi:MAG: hypothetical protein KDD78_13755, partial [Caldilineaceae bacterium]|nr:hypothetical protein [Caldilineaceae bacterium]